MNLSRPFFMFEEQIHFLDFFYKYFSMEMLTMKTLSDNLLLEDVSTLSG